MDIRQYTHKFNHAGGGVVFDVTFYPIISYNYLFLSIAVVNPAACSAVYPLVDGSGGGLWQSIRPSEFEGNLNSFIWNGRASGSGYCRIQVRIAGTTLSGNASYINVMSI